MSMRRLFVAIAAALILASLATWADRPERRSEVPIITWVTDPNPARQEQVALFHEWLVKNGHVSAEGEPVCELRLDTVNRWPHKQIIQGVSGVAGDIHDTFSGDGLQILEAIGMMSPLDDRARAGGFEASRTYPALASEICVDGQQFMFPCNVGSQQLWVNREAFERAGLPTPPARWSLDDFERIGKAYVAAANKVRPDSRRFFFASELDRTVLIRSLGLSKFNETLTRCTLDDPRYITVLERIARWTDEDRLLPSDADRAALNIEGGFGWPGAQLFASGRYALLLSSRYMVIRFRAMNRDRQRQGRALLQLAAVEHPHGGFPNAAVATRCAGIYRGSERKDLAALFLAFLASEDYNRQIVRDGDDLPPDPAFTRSEEFLRPKDWPNEWGSHEVFDRSLRELAIGGSWSPFALAAAVGRKEWEAFGGFMNRRWTASEAAQRAARAIDAEIERGLREDPGLRPRYAAWSALQDKIDAARKRGDKVPSSWLKNPFHRRYYKAMGWIRED